MLLDYHPSASQVEDIAVLSHFHLALSVVKQSILMSSRRGVKGRAGTSASLFKQVNFFLSINYYSDSLFFFFGK